MPKINMKRFLISLIVGLVVVVILFPVQELFTRWLDAFSGLPQEVIVEQNIGVWMMLMLLVNIIFFVFVPMAVYVFIVEKILRKSSLVLGLFFGLCTFLSAALPQFLILPLLLKVPFTFSIVRAFWSIFNLTLVGGIIGGIYKPLEIEIKQNPLTQENNSPI